MTIYCSSSEYDGLMKALKECGAIAEESDSDMAAAVKEWADSLFKDASEQEGLYEQISKYNHGTVDNSTDLVE